MASCASRDDASRYVITHTGTLGLVQEARGFDESTLGEDVVPKTAIMAAPMNFSTVPPWASNAAFASAK